MKRLILAFLLLPVLASAQHRVYKAGNRVMISGQGMNNSAPSENVNIYRVNDRIRVDYGTSGVWLNANTFLDAMGKPWGNTIDRAIFNYFEEANSVTVSNLSTDTVNVRLANRQSIQTVIGDVNVKNLPSTQPVTVTNWPTSQTINGTVNANVTFPTTQQVGGTVSVGNFPANQNVTVGNFPASQAVTGTFWPATQPVSGTVSVSNLPATQPISGTVTVANPTTSVSVGNFPSNQTVTVSNPVTAVSATISGIPQVQIVPTESKWQFFSNSLSAVTGIDLAPAQAGKRNHLVGLQVAGLVPLLSGDVQILDGNTVIYQFALAANATLSVVFDQPLFSSPGNALRIRCAVTGLNMRISAQGFAIAN